MVGMDRVFPRLLGISLRLCPQEIPQSSPASPWKKPVQPSSFTWINPVSVKVPSLAHFNGSLLQCSLAALSNIPLLVCWLCCMQGVFSVERADPIIDQERCYLSKRYLGAWLSRWFHILEGPDVVTTWSNRAERSLTPSSRLGKKQTPWTPWSSIFF